MIRKSKESRRIAAEEGGRAVSLRMNKYTQYYTVSEILDGNGKRKQTVTYTGPYYRFQVDSETYKKMKFAYAAFAAVTVLAYVLAALLGASSMGEGGAPAFFVVLPFVLLLLPLGMCAGKIFMFLPLEERLTFPQYDKYVKALKTYAVLFLVFSVLLLIGQLVYLAFFPANTHDFFFAALAAVLAGAGVFFRWFQNKYICTLDA